MPDPSEDQWAAIQADLFAGRKISAIKVYREATGVGLKEAKDAMEAYADRLRNEHPERFTANSKGCASMILLFAGVLAGTGWLARTWIA